MHAFIHIPLNFHTKLLNLEQITLTTQICNEFIVLRNKPVMGLEQAVHLLAKSSPKQSAQYGFSSREVKRCPASDVLQWVHVKHSRCHGSFL